jgi:hypothetical protein
MKLFQLLLPLLDNEGKLFEEDLFRKVRAELTETFGGLTAFSRAPAEGLWTSRGETKRDDILVLEVMAPEIDRPWWRAYRAKLESLFRQDEIVIRVQDVETL